MSEVTELHDPFMRWLRAENILYRRSRPDRATSEACGEPDFSLYGPGRPLFVEFKMPKTGKLSTAQLFRHSEYERAGCHVFVLRDLQSAINVVNEWRSQEPEPATPERLERILGAWWRKTDKGMEKVRNT